MPKIGILLVGDDALTRGGLAAILSGQPDLTLVGEAESLPVLDRRAGPDPDVIIIRTAAVDPAAVAAHGAFTGSRGTPRVVVVTETAGEPAAALMRLGFCAVIHPGITPGQLIAAVRLVAAGYLPVHQPMIRGLVRTERGLDPGLLAALTEREREVLGLLAGGRSNAEIAAALSIAESTVKSHVKRILRKLKVHSRLQAALHAQEPLQERPQACPMG